MYNKLTKSFSVLTMLAASLAATNALADCTEFGSDQWNALSMDMVDAYDKGDLDVSLDLCKQLSAICDESPVVNYTMSEIYRKKGDENESYNYVKRASEFLKGYAVPQSLVERIWLRRAEFEQPFKQTKEKLAESEAKIAQLQAGRDSDALHIQMLTTEKDAALQSLESLNTIKWTGTGIAIGGALIAAGGAALVGIYHSKADEELTKDGGGKFNDYNVMVQTGVGMIAGGAAIGIVGSVFAIYSHVKLSDAKSAMTSDDQTVSFTVSPTSVGMQLRF